MRKQIISVVLLTLMIGRLRRNFFLRLQESWGPHIVDCFANFLQRNYQDLFPLLESGDIRGDCSKFRV